MSPFRFFIFPSPSRMPDTVLIILRRCKGPETKEKFIFMNLYQMFNDVEKDHPRDLGVSVKLILFNIFLFFMRRLLAGMAYLVIRLRKSLKKREDIFILIFTTIYLRLIRWAMRRPERACVNLVQRWPVQ